MGRRRTVRTSMYETSTVNMTFGSALVFTLTRSNSSIQVKGIIPLSCPSLRGKISTPAMTQLETNGTYIPSY